MSLSNAVLKTGATWSPSGGTDVTFVPSGRSLQSGIELVASSDTSLILRRSLELKASLPSLPPASNAYAKLGRRSLVYRIPYVAADGKLYTQSVRLEAAFHADDTRQNTLIADCAAFFADADFTSFWQSFLLT